MQLKDTERQRGRRNRERKTDTHRQRGRERQRGQQDRDRKREKEKGKGRKKESRTHTGAHLDDSVTRSWSVRGPLSQADKQGELRGSFGPICVRSHVELVRRATKPPAFVVAPAPG